MSAVSYKKYSYKNINMLSNSRLPTINETDSTLITQSNEERMKMFLSSTRVETLLSNCSPSQFVIITKDNKIGRCDVNKQPKKSKNSKIYNRIINLMKNISDNSRIVTFQPYNGWNPWEIRVLEPACSSSQ